MLSRRHLNFWILAFSTNFCPIRTSLSGNTVWPKASGFQKLAKIDQNWPFLIKLCPRKRRQNGFEFLKWSRVASNDFKWFQMTSNGLEWPRMTSNSLKWPLKAFSILKLKCYNWLCEVICWNLLIELFSTKWLEFFHNFLVCIECNNEIQLPISCRDFQTLEEAAEAC